MKFTVLIFAVYISLLTVQPVMTAIASVYTMQTVECCREDCSNHEQKNNKEKQNEMCNPFQMCSYCCGCYISEQASQAIIIQQIQALHPTVADSFTSDFCDDCFHPPRNV